MSRRRYVLLDRDGTVNRECHYLSDPEQLELLPGAADGLRQFQEMGLGLVVITNQSAVSRGLIDSSRLDLIHQRLRTMLDAEGVRLNAIYACPHTPEEECRCRKPRLGLLEAAAKQLDFDPGGSFVIGDKVCDIEFGRRAGATTLLVRTGYGHAFSPSGGIHPDFIVDDLRAAATVVRERMGGNGDGEAILPPGDVRPLRIRSHLYESARVKEQIAEQEVASILAAADLISAAFRSGRKVMLCGNGGSAADCQHTAAELVSRLRKDFERPGLPAVALTTDTSFLTAFSNDCGFEGVFERQVQALGREGDVLIGITTSGRSPNVVRALKAARAGQMQTIVLTGKGGTLWDLADVVISVPSRDTQLIQEAHLAVEHLLCELVECGLFEEEGEESRDLPRL
jgi:phosphoheptose isomerase